MKKNMFQFLGLVFFALMLSVQGCDTDACKNVECGTNGACFEGTCLCDPGYEGTDCNVVIRNQFLGTYSVTEDCAGTPFGPYTAEVIVAGDIDKVLIKNLGNYACEDGGGNPLDYFVEATVSAGGLINFTTATCGTDFEGSGSISTANGIVTITITYSATYDPGTGLTTDNCTASFMR